VHKARWLGTPPSRESLNDALAKVSDRAWAAAQCASVVARTYELQRVIIVHGLRETERHIPRVKVAAAAAAAGGGDDDDSESDSDSGSVKNVEVEGSPQWSWQGPPYTIPPHSDSSTCAAHLRAGMT